MASLLFLVAALAGALGVLGDDLRWFGVLALSEVALGRLLWWSRWLGRWPWASLGLRLVGVAVGLRGLDIPMPGAPLVGSMFVASALGGLAWVGVLRLAGENGGRQRELLVGVGVYAVVGLWSMGVGVPPSGWTPIVMVLAADTALSSRRAVPLAPADAEES